MPEEIKKESNLDELMKLAKENNRLLHGMRHAMIVGQVLAWVKFLIIVVPLVIAYFYLKPYYKDTMKFYQDIFGNATAGRINILEEFKDIVNQK